MGGYWARGKICYDMKHHSSLSTNKGLPFSSINVIGFSALNDDGTCSGTVSFRIDGISTGQ